MKNPHRVYFGDDLGKANPSKKEIGYTPYDNKPLTNELANHARHSRNALDPLKQRPLKTAHSGKLASERDEDMETPWLIAHNTEPEYEKLYSNKYKVFWRNLVHAAVSEIDLNRVKEMSPKVPQ